MKFAAICVYVDDVPATLDFYRRAFDFETRFFDEALQYAELETGAAVVAFASHRLGEMLLPGAYVRPESGQPSGVEIAFVTSDVPAAFAKAVAAGAVVVAEPKVMPWGQTTAYLRSIEGTLVALVTPMVLEVLEERFGPPPAELAAAIRASKDSAQQRLWLDLATRAASLKQFRQDANL
jgi:uncharacterized glyoxalase superfamily protein PhnB